MCVLEIYFCYTDTATTEIYTLSLHDALPISSLLIIETEPVLARSSTARTMCITNGVAKPSTVMHIDRKSTRLNSSHSQISYAVFCLKKKKDNHTHARYE